MIAIYARQSVDKKDSISIETQIETCHKIIASPVLASKVYSDKGYSGSNTNRPQFEEMMKDIQSGLIERVVVYKLDRISRSLLDFAQIYDTFEKRHVEFISCNEQFDTSTPMGKAMLGIIMVFAQLERETIQMRIKDNYYARGEKGMYLGGRPPYGFIKVKTKHNDVNTYKYEINEEQAEIVTMLFMEYADTDIAFGQLVKKINGMGIKTNNGNSWSNVQVGRLIKNPAYVRANADVYLFLKNKGAKINNDVCEFTGIHGCYLYAERKGVTTAKFTNLSKSFVTLGLHEGIIDADTWLRCQYKAEKNQVAKNSGKGMLTWLTGLMKCGYCGLAVTAVSGRAKLLYITCGGRKKFVCYGRKKTIYVKDLEEIVEAKLLEKLRTLKVTGKSNKNIDSQKLDTLKAQLVTVEEQISKLVTSLLDMSDISAKYIDAKIAELDKQKYKIQTEMNDIMRNETRNDFNERDLQEYIDNWAGYDLEQKKAIAKSVINRVLITDEEIVIEFKI